jgi:hypothetical protein
VRAQRPTVTKVPSAVCIDTISHAAKGAAAMVGAMLNQLLDWNGALKPLRKA